jgi:hypothetical protein
MFHQAQAQFEIISLNEHIQMFHQAQAQFRFVSLNEHMSNRLNQ